MINIEGTPHEKALIVISSYIIGFVSAYIAFTYAFPVHGPQPVISYVPVAMQTAAVSDSQSEVATPQTSAPALVTESAVDVVYENQGLYLYGVAEEPVLLSKAAEALGVSYSDDMSLVEKQGLHAAVPAYAYFDESNFVFYCESYEVATECVPYLYDVTESTLRVIQSNSEPVVLDVATATQVSVGPSGGLRFGEYASIDPATPWQVGQ